MKPEPSGPVRVLVATANAGKLSEIRSILCQLPISFTRPRAGAVSFPAEGVDYAENALAKARAVASQLGEWAVADDSGLEVNALGGAPGPRSARYGGSRLKDRERVELLLAELAGTPLARRGARFVCCAALVTPDGDERTTWGECRGRIAHEPRGEGGFGYDPIFRLEGRHQTMAELCSEEKNRLSHRARAFRSLGRELIRCARQRQRP